MIPSGPATIFICFPPGAINILPGSTTSPFSASLTSICDLLLRLFARDAVNNGGICCTINIADLRPFGSIGTILISALGPPVEIPIPITSDLDLRTTGLVFVKAVLRTTGFGIAVTADRNPGLNFVLFCFFRASIIGKILFLTFSIFSAIVP